MASNVLNMSAVLRADTAQARRELAAAGAQIKGLGAAGEVATRGVDTASVAMQALTRAAVAAAGAVTAALATGALARAADAWSDMSSRVGAAVRDMAAAPALMQDMLRLANSSYSDLNQTVETFARNVVPMRDLGFTTRETLDFTEALNHALVITATKGERAAAVQQALGKAMATGRLDALGLETVLANGGRVAEALASQLGTSVSGLRGLASQGRITGDVIARALLGALEDVRREAGEMPATIADGFLKIGNSTTALIGAVDQALGASAAVAAGLDGISQRIAALAAMDFSGLLDGITHAATLLGEALLVLAATRIPALVVGVASLNVGVLVMNAQLIAGAVAMRAGAVAAAAFALAALAFMGGPLGLALAGMTALGLYLWNSHRATQAARQAMVEYDASLRGAAGAATLTEEAIRKMSETQILASRQRAGDEIRRLADEMRNAADEFAQRMMLRNTMASEWAAGQVDGLVAAFTRGEMKLGEFRRQMDMLAGIMSEQDLAQLSGILDFAGAMETSAEGIARTDAVLRVFNGTATEADRELLGLGRDGAAAGAAVAGGMSAAARAASGLSAELRGASSALQALVAQVAGLGFDNIGRAAQLEALKAGRSVEDARVTGLVAQERARLQPLLDQGAEVTRYARQQLSEFEAGQRLRGEQDAEIATYNRTATTGGVGGGAASAQGSVAQELLQSQRQELDLLRAIDPVQRAVIENREALAAASAGGAAQIRANIAEIARMKEVRETVDQIGEAGRSAFVGLVNGTLSFREALGQLLGRLAELAANSLWDQIWSGGAGGSGGPGGILLGLLTGQTKADGGLVSGPGGPREDNLLHWLSAGEYVVNAAATRANLPLLEAVNRGLPAMDLLKGIARAPQLATGGLVGGASFVSALPGRSAGSGPSTGQAGAVQQVEVRLRLDSALLQAEVERVAGPVALRVTQAGVAQAFDHHDRNILPGRVRQITGDPWSA